MVDLTDESVMYATRLLADLGADVIRIESPGSDRIHPWAREGIEAGRDGGERNVLRQYFGAGKRSVALDLSRTEGLEIFGRLCSGVDVVMDGIESIFDSVESVHARVREANPRLTWVAVREFAPDAAQTSFKSCEIVRYALSGLMSITGDPQGSPMLVGGGVSNAIVAAYAALASVLGAMSARERGRGQLVWVSAYEALLTVMQQGLFEAALGGRVVSRAGSRHAHIAMAGALPCRDGHVVISANERSMWRALVEMIGDERLRDDELNDEGSRMRRQGEIFQILAGWAEAFAKSELSRVGQARQIPVAPVNSLFDVLSDVQLRSRGFFQNVGGEGDMAFLNTPWAERGRPAPRRGEHTEAVLQEVGLARDEIKALEAEGIVVQAAARSEGGAWIA